MPFSKQLPAPVSHLKARLRALKRPMVWGPGIILVLIVLFTLEYWLHPEWFENARSANEVESGFNPDVSLEDGAIGADIDSLSLLLNQFNNAPVEQTQTQPQTDKDKVATRPSLFNELLKPANPAATQNGNSTPSNSLSSSPAASPASPLRSSSGGLPNQPLSGSTPGFTGINSPGLPATAPSGLLPTPGASTIPNLNLPTAASAPAPAPVSALQTALEQAQLQKNAAADSTPSSTAGLNNSTAVSNPNQSTTQPNAIAPGFNGGGINYSSTPGVSSAPSSNSFNYLTQPQPDTSFPSGVAPSAPDASGIAPVVPSTTNLGPNFGQPVQGSPSNNGFSNSGSSGNAGLQPSQLNQQPFSVPRRTPGRNIGGGQINTFSNP